MDNDLTLEWLRFANMDLDAAQVLFRHRPQHLEIICYHCQQAAEKFLKSFLVSRGMEDVPKTHNLSQLCMLCMSHNNRFAEIMKPCSALTPYGVQPRYPDEIHLDESLVQKALAYAQEIKSFIEKTLEENT